MDKKNDAKFHRMFLVPIFLVIIIIVGVFWLNKTLQLNETGFDQALEETVQLSHLQLEHSELSRWQSTIGYSQDPAVLFHSRRRLEESEERIEDILLFLTQEGTQRSYEGLSQDVENLLLMSQALLVMEVPAERYEAILDFESQVEILNFQIQRSRNTILEEVVVSNSRRLLWIIMGFIAAMALLALSSLFLAFSSKKRKQAEMLLLRTRNYLSNVLNSMPSVLIGIEPDGSVTEINREAEMLFQQSQEAARGKPIDQLLPKMSSYMPEIQSAIEKKELLSKHSVRLQENKSSVANLTAFPLVMNGVQGAVIRIDDVTKQVKLEEELRQSHKMNAIGQLAGGIAHDFNNMLTGILGTVDILEDYLDPEGKEFLDLITESAQRSAELTQQLLSFAHKGRMSLIPVDIHHSIDSAVQLLEHSIRKDISIERHFYAEQSVVSGDKAQLENIFLNLGINSSQAIAKEGTITYRTDEVRLDLDYCSTSQFDLIPGRYLQIEVRDSGKGIPLENLERIFEPFFTTKEEGKGTGLGLSTVYGIVIQMNGAISVYSELGRGTVFHILLPISLEKERTQVSPDYSQFSGTGRVLIVDDEKAVRKSAGAILSKAGYSLEFAEDGQEAVDILGNSEPFDLVLLDMVMPRMNGKECFYSLRELDPSVPIIMASGFSQSKDVDELRARGLNGFLRKPFRREELLSKVFRVLKNPQEK